MFSDRIALSSAEIFEKEFKIDARGYRLQEVDNFLDVENNDIFFDYKSLLEKENIEIVGWHRLNQKGLNRKIKTTNKNGGQSIITDR